MLARLATGSPRVPLLLVLGKDADPPEEEIFKRSAERGPHSAGIEARGARRMGSPAKR